MSGEFVCLTQGEQTGGKFFWSAGQIRLDHDGASNFRVISDGVGGHPEKEAEHARSLSAVEDTAEVVAR
jgi:hypothetical protein